MLVARAVSAHRSGMHRRDVAHVAREPVARVQRVEATHDAIPGDLGDDRCGRDRGTPCVAVDDGAVRGCERAQAKTVDEAGFRAWREIGENVTQPLEVRAVEPMAVDVTRRDHTNRHLRRRLQDGEEKRFAHLGIDLLGIVQQGERPRAASLERVVVEQDTGDDEWSRERSSARLVCAGNEADAEPSVVA